MKEYRIKPGSKVDLSKWTPNDTGKFKEGKEAGLVEVNKLNSGV
ncbi:MAG: hypothetical protein Fur0016_11970 [Anaerolineales bacterium]